MSTKLIRRALIASGLVISATTAFSPTAFAETTATVGIGGEVDTTLAVALTADTANTDIDLDAGKTNEAIKVADFTMGTNNSTGLKLTPSWTGPLSNGTTSANIPFTVAVAVDAGTPGAYVASGSVAIDTLTAASTASPYNLYIKYTTGAEFQDPGSYNASILLTVADN